MRYVHLITTFLCAMEDLDESRSSFTYISLWIFVRIQGRPSCSKMLQFDRRIWKLVRVVVIDHSSIIIITWVRVPFAWSTDCNVIGQFVVVSLDICLFSFVLNIIKQTIRVQATVVACGWAGAVMKKANLSIWAGAVMQMTPESTVMGNGDRPTDRLTDRSTDQQTDWQTDRQTDWQTG